MPKIEFNPQISFGNIVTMLAFALTLAVAWGEKNQDVEGLAKSDAKHDAALSSADTAIRSLERSHERILERLDGLKVTVERIEKKIP